MSKTRTAWRWVVKRAGEVVGSPAEKEGATMSDVVERIEDPEIYVKFDAFLKRSIHDYYKISGKKRKGNFIALLIVSGEMTSLAVDSIKDGSGAKRLAFGAAGVLALRIGLRYALGGPLGLVVAGVTVASLVAYFIRNRGEIAAAITRNRQLVAELRKSYDKTQSDFRDARFSEDQRNLMLDGLMKRFLSDLDA
jgi:hypothetical protein